jgi:hypothetical protein
VSASGQIDTAEPAACIQATASARKEGAKYDLRSLRDSLANLTPKGRITGRKMNVEGIQISNNSEHFNRYELT